MNDNVSRTHRQNWGKFPGAKISLIGITIGLSVASCSNPPAHENTPPFTSEAESPVAYKVSDDTCTSIDLSPVDEFFSIDDPDWQDHIDEPSTGSIRDGIGSVNCALLPSENNVDFAVTIIMTTKTTDSEAASTYETGITRAEQYGAPDLREYALASVNEICQTSTAWAVDPWVSSRAILSALCRADNLVLTVNMELFPCRDIDRLDAAAEEVLVPLMANALSVAQQ